MPQPINSDEISPNKTPLCEEKGCKLTSDAIETFGTEQFSFSLVAYPFQGLQKCTD
jgi:hypothetical protein